MNVKKALNKMMNPKKINEAEDKITTRKILDKVLMNFRVSVTARDILIAIAEQKGLSMTSVLEQMIREEAKREKIVIKLTKKGLVARQ